MGIVKKWLEQDLGLIQMEKPLPFYPHNRVKKQIAPPIPFLRSSYSAPVKDEGGFNENETEAQQYEEFKYKKDLKEIYIRDEIEGVQDDNFKHRMMGKIKDTLQKY